MFFSSKIIDALIEDHRRIQEQMNILKNPNLTISEKNEGFTNLVAVLSSHTRREESAIYSYMNSSNKDELKMKALEGIEEHHIVNELIDSMRLPTPFSKEWLAKSQVLAELIEHHLHEEETVIFPLLKKKLNAEIDKNLYEKYTISSFDTNVRPDLPTMNSPM